MPSITKPNHSPVAELIHDSSYFTKSTQAKQLARQGIVLILPPKTDATTFSLSSNSILLLWLLSQSYKMVACPLPSSGPDGLCVCAGAATVRLEMPVHMQSALIFHYNLKFYNKDADNFEGVSLKRFVMQVTVEHVTRS